MLVDVSANLCFSPAYLVQSFEVPNTIKCPVRRQNKDASVKISHLILIVQSIFSCLSTLRQAGEGNTK